MYVAGIVAFVTALVLVLTKRYHSRFSMDGVIGVQKIHQTPTPRVGGVAVVAGVLGGWLVAKPERAEILHVLLYAGIPAFVFGFAEDVSKKVSVRARLLATMASGVLGWWLTGVSITRVDIPIIDFLLSFTMVSVAFTALAVGGVANAVNIIDGFNGLASGFVVIALLGLSLAAGMVGDLNLSIACLAIAASMVGFWLINWPWGKLFLGDGGSYFAGFVVAWAGVMLVERNSSVSAFVPLLICIHPVTEVLFSIYRRRIKKSSPGRPDLLHLHSLMMRRVVYPRLRRAYLSDPSMAMQLRNPITGLLIAFISAPAVVVSFTLINTNAYTALACVAFALGYVTLYARLVRFHWCSPLSFLFVKPV